MAVTGAEVPDAGSLSPEPSSAGPLSPGLGFGPRPIRPLERPVPLRQSVYDALVELVVGGELRPGQHLVETELARQLGVSRQPVREALHRLEAEGWVDLRPSQGAFVHVPTDQEVDELLDVRELLEAETARRAVRAATPEGVARLRVIWRDGSAAADSGDVQRAVAANNGFHAAIAAVAGNSVLADLAGIVGARVRWYYRLVVPARGQESWTEHLELIDAIEERNEERAVMIARKHTERTRSAYHSPTARAARLAAMPRDQGSLTTLIGSGAYGSLALSISSISQRSDMMWYVPSARYSRMIVVVPSACL